MSWCCGACGTAVAVVAVAIVGAVLGAEPAEKSVGASGDESTITADGVFGALVLPPVFARVFSTGGGAALYEDPLPPRFSPCASLPLGALLLGLLPRLDVRLRPLPRPPSLLASALCRSRLAGFGEATASRAMCTGTGVASKFLSRVKE